MTLKFGFRVDVCRVDVELWPWGMDRGQASKRLEISTSSDEFPPQNIVPAQGPKWSQCRKKPQAQVQDPNEQSQAKHQGDTSHVHQWSRQAQTWSGEGSRACEQRDSVHKRHKATDGARSSCQPGASEPEFKLVGRCELREETQVCFSRSPFSPRPPFLSPPPPPPATGRMEELWSRGLLSLGSVTQLRVTVPCGGAASALGLRALAVWGQPARCCPREEMEKIQEVHKANQRPLLPPVPSISPPKETRRDPLPRYGPDESLFDPLIDKYPTRF